MTVDYSREIELIRRLSSAQRWLELGLLAAAPVLGAAALIGRRGESYHAALEALRGASGKTQEFAVALWQHRYGADRGGHPCRAVRALVDFGRPIGHLVQYQQPYHYFDVAGIPVAREPYLDSAYFYSPASKEEILAAVKGRGACWIIDEHGDLSLDDAVTPPYLSAQTREIIDRTRPHSTCRAWVLWGPPRGGKSIAARQICQAVVGGWVRICGAAAQSGDAWAAARALGAEAIILDDLDVCAGEEGALLGHLERAREHCKVLVSTLNVLPKPNSDPERKKLELRGAILAPGRAADEEPRLYRELDPEIRAALAPTVPEAMRPPDLLAAYLRELELRKQAHGEITAADLAEMRRLQEVVGDR